MSNLIVTAVQTIQFWEDKEKNIAHFDQLLSKYDLSSTDVLVFPEMFHTGFSMNPQRLYEEMHNSAGINWLKEKSRHHNCLSVASLIIKENKHYYNRMLAIYPDGNLEYYDKRYLFSYAGEDKVYTAGKDQKIIQYKKWNILLQICFDLRFSEGSRNKLNPNSRANYDLAIYIANWPKKRIQHWETLLKARAIENQVYVVGVNRVGTDGNQHDYNGKTQIVDPFGLNTIKADDNTEMLISTEIKQNEIATIRQKMNFLNDIKTRI